MQGPHGSQDEAPGTGQERELFPARMRAGTRLRQSCWQTCSPRARCSRALRQLCLPTGAGTCGMQAAPLEWHRPSSRRSCCCPGVYHTAIIQPRGAGQNLCPPARCCGGTQQHQPPAPSGFSAPLADLRGCFPLPGALPPPVTPAAPPGWNPAGAGAPAAAEGRGCVPGGRGWVPGWGPRAGALGGYAVLPGGLWPPAPCPDTQPLALAGVKKWNNQRQSPGSGTTGSPGAPGMQGAPSAGLRHGHHRLPSGMAPLPASRGTAGDTCREQAGCFYPSQLLLSTLGCPPCILVDCRMSFPVP